ncbi:Zinc-binding oxidoreductase [Scheffersomyces stipitis CBS 6054]|uniref:Zinc-binding oxidoreductase n=1 Tax=Scheffersomyces stipitis (strain ATCC 58785 / CBS 6054 / NBRC 10063 / NRRL Y-11545) TaxID=322104 RepID=A3LQT8_PICST|nr:Zinc-binding oxidoreductase [Scheffersomyces stipitis CBS 6054]ABN65265.1 Zinc-binding oxidoreductase [Scheffersomyces stipitis CBS 6054]KAG2733917.1 hypothetical protein G9P44_003442 [Scheffersomyces stipitis]
MTVTNIKAAIVPGTTGEGELTEVATISLPQLSADQILIKSVAYAVNPTDWKHIAYGLSPKNAIAGSDVAGVVEKVGANVKGFKEGDKVSGFIHGNTSATVGAFGEYALLNPDTAIKYEASQISDKPLSVGEHPADLLNTFEGIAGVSLGLVTVSLSFAHSLQIPADKEKNKNASILIWGGATATGVLAIQLAKLVYGLNVIATASSKNHEFLKSIGADATFDYKDVKVVEAIKTYAKGSILYALDTVASPTTFQATYDATEGAESVAIDNLLALNGSSITTKPERKTTYGRTLAYTALGESIDLGGGVVPSTPELMSDYLNFWKNVLPPYIPLLKHSNLKVLPAGLESASSALELLRQDKVSGEKVVFRFD